MTTFRVGVVVLASLLVAPARALAQAGCGLPVAYPAGASCAGGPADGRPCYVYDAGDNFGCPGGTCVPSPGGGRATYYSAATGACGIPVSGPEALVTAVAEYLWEGSAVCGMCALVAGPLGSVVVEITDLCPAIPNPQWCAGDAAHLDLSEGAFAVIADPARGVTYVAWEIVECPVEGNVTVMNKDGSNPWWYAAFALDLRHGVTALEVRDASPGASWIPGVRQDYNAWVVESASGLELPLSMRLTDVTASVVTAVDVVTDFADFSLFDMGDQFPVCSVFSDGFESGDTSAWSYVAP